MPSDLLKREAEFVKLNKELELRTQALMQEVDSVMKLQNEFIKPKINSSNHIQKKNSVSNKKLPYSGVVDDDKGNDIPECSQNMGMQGLTRFLKAKVNMLQKEVNSLQTEYKQKCEELKKLQNEAKIAEDEKNKTLNQLNNYKDQNSKHEDQIKIISNRLQSKETENISLRKEVDSLKKELKSVISNNSNNELRHNRAVEEIEKLKALLTKSKQDEKEYREVNRRQVAEMTSTIKKLEKQNTEVANAFRKQLLLIDNLKKQKAHIESSRLIHISEDEFVKILDWDLHEKKNYK